MIHGIERGIERPGYDAVVASQAAAQFLALLGLGALVDGETSPLITPVSKQRISESFRTSQILDAR